MNHEFIPMNSVKKLNTFAEAAAKEGYEVSSVITKGHETNGISVSAIKGNSLLTFTWHEDLAGCCKNVCGCLGPNYDKCNLTKHSLSEFQNEDVVLIHSVVRHVYDNGAFVLSQVSIDGGLDLNDRLSTFRIAESVVKA